MLIGKKEADVKAPAGSDAGPEGTGAVDWLFLGNKGGSVGLEAVYRVETAGGSAPSTCQGVDVGGVISVQYAAEYWFYGA